MTKRPQHEKLPKELAPETGGVYTLVHEGEALYEAEIVKYSGGCWATVRVTDPLKHADTYKIGDEFQIRVAMYQFLADAEQAS
jgi:hypothetical protein